jgi:hypothetical protein
VLEEATPMLNAGSMLKKGKIKVAFDGNGQALLRVRLKEVVVAAAVQQGVDTCRHERLTGVLEVGRIVAL